ncbi:MAG: hypothetical protein R3B68_15270 [Phycisphaerales bacterium]
MDLSNPVALMSGLVIGGLGAAMFIFGTKQQRLMPVLGGVALSVLPMVVTSMLLLWGLTAACLGGVYWMEKNS